MIPVGFRIKCTPLAWLRRPCRFCMLPGCHLPVTTISTPGSTSCHYSTARILHMATYLPSAPLHLQDLMSYFSGNSLDICTLESLLQHPRLHCYFSIAPEHPGLIRLRAYCTVLESSMQLSFPPHCNLPEGKYYAHHVHCCIPTRTLVIQMCCTKG